MIKSSQFRRVFLRGFKCVKILLIQHLLRKIYEFLGECDLVFSAILNKVDCIDLIEKIYPNLGEHIVEKISLLCNVHKI